MNTAVRSILALVAGMCFLLPAMAERATKLEPTVASADDQRRTALVIGNSAYESAPLRNPINDARAVAQLLAEVGFSVTLMEDATEAGMIRSIRDFGDALARGGVGLFYYAGHGMQLRGRNFLIPVGADIRREDEVEYQAVDADRVLAKMESAKNGLNIVILDACRNNPFARSFRSSKNGLAEMNAPTGTLIAFATAPGSIAADGEGENSLYTKHLLERMRSPGLPIERVMKQVRVDVTRETGDQQVPWESSSLKGDFFFIPPDPRNTAEGRRKAQQEAIERALKEADARAAREREALLQKAAEERAALEIRMKALIKQALAKQAQELESERRARGAARVQAPAGSEVPLESAEPVEGGPGNMTSQPAAESGSLASARTAGRETQPDPAQALRPSTEASESERAPLSTPKLEPERVASLAPEAATRMPRPGDSWTYRVIRGDSAPMELSVRIDSVFADSVYETTWDQIGAKDWVYTPDAIILGSAAGPQWSGFFDFSPYIQAYASINDNTVWPQVSHARLGACVKHQCAISAKAVGRERIKVPAGEFDALRIEVDMAITMTGRNWGLTVRRGTYWYVPEVKRYVRMTVKTQSGRWGDEDFDSQLVAYKLKSP